jgi:hypothetical protein
MEWKNPDGSLTGGVVIEDGAGNKLGTAGNPLNVTGGGGGGGGGSNASVGVTGSAVPADATAIGYQNASGNLAIPSASAGLPISDTGVSASGVSQPAGGSGLSGWLSGIYSKLSGTLSVSWSGQSVSVSNLPATQPISAAALPLPGGAALDTSVQAVKTALGSPLQAGGSVSVSNLPATQAISLVDGADATLGSKGDAIAAVASGFAGSFSLVAVAKQIVTALLGYLNVNVGIGGAAISHTNSVPVSDAYAAPVVVTWNSSTVAGASGTGAANAVATAGMDGVMVSLVASGAVSGGHVTFEAYDGAAWLPIKGFPLESYYSYQGYTLASGLNNGLQFDLSGCTQFRVRLDTAITGSGSVAVTLNASSAPLVPGLVAGLDPTAANPVTLQAGTSNVGFISETYANLATAQVSVGATATLIVAARAGRKEVTIVNHGTTALYLGPSAVSATTGQLLAGVAGEGVTYSGGAAVYGVTVSGSQTVSVAEVY